MEQPNQIEQQARPAWWDVFGMVLTGQWLRAGATLLAMTLIRSLLSSWLVFSPF